MPNRDFPPSQPHQHAHLRARSPTVEVNTERRSKRRKLQHDTHTKTEYTCYKYGHKGQVVPGRLRMQIVSCDGGEHRKATSPGLYRVQNVLRNDNSVYCSTSSRCNLLLKHIGEASFALEKVVIRAPDRGFTAPVQEGLVFVSMSADELLSGTAAYHLQYNSSSRLRSPSNLSQNGEVDSQDELLSFREAIHDTRIQQHNSQPEQAILGALMEQVEDLHRRSHRSSVLHTEGTDPSSLAARIFSLHPPPAPLAAARQRHHRSDPERRQVLRQMVQYEEDQDLEICDPAAGELFHDAVGMSAHTPPPFTVTTATEEEESDSNEEISSPAIMADRLNRESRWCPDSDEEGGDGEDGDEDGDYMQRPGPLRRAPALAYSTYSEWQQRRERYVEPIRAARVAAPSRIQATENQTAAGTIIPPHARFFIAKNKNKITIKFTPAISGKHVLLKLWSPKYNGNIDIESVQFYGYSGPRFFPATQPR